MSVVYATSDDEREAREIAENLWDGWRRKAIVHRVADLVRYGDIGLLNPGALRTTDRFAVIASPAGLGGAAPVTRTTDG